MKKTDKAAVACIAFSDRGFALAQRIAEALGGTADRCGGKAEVGPAEGTRTADRGPAPESTCSVHTWTEQHFAAAEALVYVGAAGIAVRAIAPFVKDKAADPAVVVIDECALHVIPILSGHLGGANDLARRIAGLTGSDCVITTGTDVNGVFAVDEWSKRQNCALLETEKILRISGTLLSGGKVTLCSPWEIAGDPPDGIEVISGPEAPGADPGEADIRLDIRAAGEHPLHLVPRICVLGVGCRRRTSAEAIEERFRELLELTGVHPAAICAAASIDLKKDEPGLASFCMEHGWPLLTYSGEQLQNVEGEFTASAFVASVTGTDNVCERSAMLAAGPSGTLLQGKLSGDGVTMALAMKPYEPDWNWIEELPEKAQRLKEAEEMRGHER